MWETKNHEKYWDGNKDKAKDANEMTQQIWTVTDETTTFCEILLCTNHFSSKEAIHLAHIMPESYRNTLLTCDKET